MKRFIIKLFASRYHYWVFWKKRERMHILEPSYSYPLRLLYWKRI